MLNAPPFPAAVTCLVCGTPLPTADARSSRVCRNLVCRWRHATLSKAEMCAVCSRPLGLLERAAGVCHDETCRRTWFLSRHRQHVRKCQAELDARAHARRASDAIAAGIADPDRYAITITPALDSAIVRLPLRRRRAFRARLRAVVAEAIARPNDPADAASTSVEDPPPELGAILGAACGGCRGYCCREGAEHAYLSPARMRRHLAEHPGQTADEVVAAYAAHLPMASQRGSCVFHGASGCALPRALRSDTCNRFFCGALAQVRRAHARGDAGPRYFAASHDWRVLRAEFVDGRPAPSATERTEAQPIA